LGVGVGVCTGGLGVGGLGVGGLGVGGCGTLPKVDPIGPNLIFEKDTVAEACSTSTIAGSPEPSAQGPRLAPGAFEPRGHVASSQAMFTE